MAVSWREETLRALEARGETSVLILGGGINGCGLFRELALQGVDCLLVDMADFSAGASSKASRMIHGGLRYLENGEFRLVREALLERNRLLRNAPHYVTPLETTIPLFSWTGGLLKSPLIFLGLPLNPGGRGALIVKLGLTFYDFVTRKDRRTPKHRLLSRDEALRTVPGLHPGIVGAATYWDARISQAERLCIELILDAQRSQAGCRALNYASVEGLEGGAVLLRDGPTGKTLAVRPRIVVNATGAWVDIANLPFGLHTSFMGGTKGSHLVVDNPELRRAIGDRMVYYENADGRTCLIYGFNDKVLIGSTDIRVDDPDQAVCDEAEVEYMLGAVKAVFPDLQIAREEIVYKFCGVRPLPRASEGFTGKIPRDHRIEVLDRGVGRPFPIICLVGGKWTTFRALAEQAADETLRRLDVPRRSSTEETPIGGGGGYPAAPEEKARWIERAASESGLTPERITVLLDRYGTAAQEYASSARSRPGAETPLVSLPEYTAGEIERIAAGEFVEHLSDIACRRSVIALLGRARREALEELARIAGGVLGWDEARRDDEVRRALAEVERG
jgi:glycerol-3-phosphate dehydrogenase